MDRRITQCTNIHESQFGFMPGRSTIDAIFILRQTTFIEKHREEGPNSIRVTFIELEKAYDRIPREEIWRCSRERDVPGKYIRLVQDMSPYRGCKTVVRRAGVESNSFGWWSVYTKAPVPTPDGCVDRGCEKRRTWMNDVRR